MIIPRQYQRQWLGVKFKPEDRRTYTYHNDGEPVAVGDEVIVPTKQGTVDAQVKVVEISANKPPFMTWPIKGKAQ